MRLQLALNVNNIDEAVTYYSALFDSEPHKRRTGYANFAIENPPLKLVLIENPDADDRINHLGVEVDQAKALENITHRLEANHLADTLEEQTTCCFATQNKVWSTEPQGLRWEWYMITDDNPDQNADLERAACCV